MCTSVLLLALSVAFNPDPLPATGPTYTVETKGSNAVAAQVENGRTVLVVTSERGRGWANITPEKGDWPENVTLRFRLSATQGFGALEGISLSTDRIVMSGSVRVTDFGKEAVTVPMKFAFVDANGKPDSSQLNGKNEAGTLDIRVLARDGGLDLTLPARMLRGSSKLSIGWTDWYRR